MESKACRGRFYCLSSCLAVEQALKDPLQCNESAEMEDLDALLASDTELSSSLASDDSSHKDTQFGNE